MPAHSSRTIPLSDVKTAAIRSFVCESTNSASTIASDEPSFLTFKISVIAARIRRTPAPGPSASEKAFNHALAIALVRKAKLTIFHVAHKNLTQREWEKFPAVRNTLERWNLLEKGDSNLAVKEKLGVELKNVDLVFKDTKKAILEYLKFSPSDLLVLATEGRTGLLRWVKPSLAEMLSQKTATKTLFVPKNANPFISHETGGIKLNRILVPVDFSPDPSAVVFFATRAAKMAEGDSKPEIILLHIGDKKQMPDVGRSDDTSIKWKEIYKQGTVAQEIIKASKEESVDLIMMATRGHDGVMDVLRGSTTQQVLRNSGCPLLAVPAN